jgi:formylglycine-generating enzyme required for sulfatase activity
MTQRLTLLFLLTIASTLPAAAQQTLTVSVRDMSGKICTSCNENEALVEVISELKLGFESSWDSVVNVVSEREEYGFFYYNLKFTVDRYSAKNRKLIIKAYRYLPYEERIELSPKLVAGLYVKGSDEATPPQQPPVKEDTTVQTPAAPARTQTQITPPVGTETPSTAQTQTQTKPPKETQPPTKSTATTQKPAATLPKQTANNAAKTALSMDMVYVQGGSFTMGCTTDRCSNNEKPAHTVTLNGYYIGKYEVTQQQWIEVMGNNPSFFKGDSLPVESVSYADIQKFIKLLNRKTGEKYRLPTEAEWEFAARGGNASRNGRYSGCDGDEQLDKFAWYHANSDMKTQNVGRLQSNELGIYDMSGNVSEICEDRLNDYKDVAQSNPVQKSGKERVHRGGAWSQISDRQQVFARSGIDGVNNSSSIGFRLAHDATARFALNHPRTAAATAATALAANIDADTVTPAPAAAQNAALKEQKAKTIPTQLTTAQIKTRIADNPKAMELFQQGIANKRNGNVLIACGILTPAIGAGVGYLVRTSTTELVGYDVVEREYNKMKTFAAVGTAVGAGLVVWGFVLKSHGKADVNKALDVFNEANHTSFKPSRQPSPALHFHLAPTLAAISYNF